MTLVKIIVSLVYLAFIFWPGMYGSFFFDDLPNIVQSPILHIKQFDFQTLMAVAESGDAGPLGRPLSVISFSLNHLYCGLSPFCFKLTNLVIHLVNSLLVGCLIYLILRGRLGKISREIVSVVVFQAVLWAVHPIQITSVLYVVQRMTSLSALFVLLGMVLHIYARQSGTPLVIALAWLMLFPLALLSKESGLIFVGYVFCYELILHPKRNGRLDRFGRVYVGTVFFLLALLLILIVVNLDWVVSGYKSRNFTISERLLTESRVLWQYLEMIFFPRFSLFALHHDDLEISRSIFSPWSTALGLVAWAVLLVTMVFQAKTKPVLIFAVAWFLVGHSLESSIIPLELMHEHRNYLPSLIFVFIILYFYIEFFTVSRIGSPAIITIAVAVVAYLSGLSYLRSEMYGDELRRTQLEVQYHPKSVRANYDAGALLVEMYFVSPNPILSSLAYGFLDKAGALDASFKLGLLAQLQLDCLEGRRASKERVDELAYRLSTGVVGVQERSTMGGIATAMAEKTLCLNRSEVDRLFHSSLSNPLLSGYDKAKILNVYGSYVWGQEGDARLALKIFDEAIGRNARDFANYFNKIQLLRYFGDREEIVKIVPVVEKMNLSRDEGEQWARLKRDLVEDRVLEK